MPPTILEVLPVGPLQCNCIILGDRESGEALVIDPGDEPNKILAALQAHGLRAKRILHTHAHIDHVGATARMHELLEADVALHPADRFLYENLAAQAEFLGTPAPPTTAVTTELRDGESVRWGSHEGEILHTPGHSPGSICLHVPKTILPAGTAPESGAFPAAEPPGGAETVPRPVLVSGDTLFWGSIGRTDLWGGSYDEIMKSIRERLLTLPDDTLVLPGHGPATTMAQEKGHNPFLRELR